MGLIVQKFGGTSVKDRDRIFNVARIVANTRNQGNDVVVVVSAQGDTTDDLITKAAELEGLKNGPITQEEVDDCRRGLLSSMDALGDSLAALENWYYGQITRGEPLYPPEYGKVLTSAVSLDEVRQTLQSYSYSVCYAVTAEPGTQGKGGSEDVE